MIQETFHRVECKSTDKTLKPDWQYYCTCKSDEEAIQLATTLNASRETLQTYRAVRIETQTVRIVLDV